MVTTPAAGIDRFCGRQLNIAVADDAVTVCSRSYPFRLGVVFDNMEVCSNAIATAANCEPNIAAANMAGGILGFALGYNQVSC